MCQSPGRNGICFRLYISIKDAFWEQSTIRHTDKQCLRRISPPSNGGASVDWECSKAQRNQQPEAVDHSYHDGR